MIPLAEFAPDRSPYDGGAGSVALNVKPVANGYAPLQLLQAYSQPLPAAPIGCFTAENADGLKVTIAGTASNLYRLNPDGTWTNVSGVTYSVPAGSRWSFAVFGNRIIATQLGNPPQYFDIGLSTVFATLAGAPQAARVAIVGDFVVLYSLLGARAQMQWSGINDSSAWTVGERLSDVNSFPDGGEIMGIVPVQGGAFVLQKDKIRQMSFAPGSPFTFTFSVANDARGSIAPDAIVPIGNGDFLFLSGEGFFRGASAQPIGAERVDLSFVKQAGTTNKISQTQGLADPLEKMAWFRSDTVEGGTISFGYDYQMDKWCSSNQDVKLITICGRPGDTLESLDAVYPGGLDSILTSFDSREFEGGTSVFAGFDSLNQLGFFSGANLAARVETNSVQLFEPDRAFLKNVQLVGNVPVASVSMQAGVTATFGDNVTWSALVQAFSATGIFYFRATGRTHRLRLNIASAASWSNIDGVLIDAVREGKR